MREPTGGLHADAPKWEIMPFGGWCVSGGMLATLVGREDAFVVTGSCTPA
jgi:hypothetical protein